MDLLLRLSAYSLLTLIVSLKYSVHSLDSHFRPDQVDIIRTNGEFKDSGTWHGPFFCPKNEYAIGFTLDWQLFRGSHESWCAQRFDNGKCRDSSIGEVLHRDDNGVTAMFLRCGSFNKPGGTVYFLYKIKVELVCR